MIYWLLAVIVVVCVVLIYFSARRRKSVPSATPATHKQCSYCKEEIPVDASVCKYCGGFVVNRS